MALRLIKSVYTCIRLSRGVKNYVDLRGCFISPEVEGRGGSSSICKFFTSYLDSVIINIYYVGLT